MITMITNWSNSQFNNTLYDIDQYIFNNWNKSVLFILT